MALKLARLKTWLSCEDAASYLAALLDEPVSVADILQLASEGQLQPSVHFANAISAKRMRKISREKAATLAIYLPKTQGDLDNNKWKRLERLRWLLDNQSSGLDMMDWFALLDYLNAPEMASNNSEDCELYSLFHGTFLGEETVLEADGEIFDISGYWNIELIGAGSVELHNRYLEEISAESCDQTTMAGIILRAPDDEEIWFELQQIHEAGSELEDGIQEFFGKFWPRKPIPPFSKRISTGAMKLPKNSHLVIHNKELQRFIASLENAENNVAMHESAVDDTVLRCTQRALAALALGLAAKPGTYNKAGKPNVSQLAKLATEHLRDGQNDRTPHGFSETTVRNTIAAALKACPELKG